MNQAYIIWDTVTNKQAPEKIAKLMRPAPSGNGVEQLMMQTNMIINGTPDIRWVENTNYKIIWEVQAESTTQE